MKRIVFTGGGTAGHIMPIIAIARELRRMDHQKILRFFYLGPKDEKAETLLAQEGFAVFFCRAGKLRRYFSVRNIADVFFNIPAGFFQSFFLLMAIRPSLVFSKGGEGAASVALASRALRIPLFLHESDIAPGLANRVASKWAERIFISFPKTDYFDLNKAIVTGNPIRKELAEGDRQTAGEILGVTFEKPVIVFCGGSQGAEPINEFILMIVNDLLKKYEVIHVCGEKNYDKTESRTRLLIEESLQKYYHLRGFLNEVELKHAYKAASLVVSRSGSGSIFEIAACGKPSILIPLPNSSFNHQLRNAYLYAEKGAAIVVEQENLIPNFFLGEIDYLFSRRGKLEEMGEAALKFSKPLAARTIAREILEHLEPPNAVK